MQKDFDHAGFVETSLMLAVSKNVKMNRAKRGLVIDGLSQSEKDKLGRLASKSFPLATKNGVWGDPREATAKKGNQLLAEIVKNIEKKCQTCLTG